MTAIVYFVAACGVLLLAQRIARISRAAAIVILLLPLLFTARALVRDRLFGPVDLAFTYEPLASVAREAGVGPVVNPSISDVFSEFMPWNDALRSSIRRGQWPLWDPYQLCGGPLAGAAQSSPYHPITLLGLIVPLRQSFALSAALMLLSAALTSFLFFREFVEWETAALFGAAGWMCSTHLLFFAGTALALAASVIPLVLLGARRVVREPGRRSITLLTIGLLLVVLAGHPESMLHIVVLAVLFFLFEVAGPAASGKRKPAVASGVVAGVLALLLTAVFLLPILEVIPQTEEYVHRALGYRQTSATTQQMLHRLIANFLPFFEGAPSVEEAAHPRAIRHGWLATAYAGSMLFVPAMSGLIRSRVRERWFLLAALVVGLLAAISGPGLSQLLSHLPGFRIAVNDRMVAFATLGMCGLAALGIDSWPAALWKSFLAVAVLMASAACFAPSGLSPDYVSTHAARAIIPPLFAACAVMLLEPRRASLLLLTLLLLQRAGEARAMQPILPGRAFYPPFPGLSALHADEPFRIVAVGAMFPPGLSTHYDLEDVRGFPATTLARLQETFPMWSVVQPVWSNRVDRLDSPILSLMNVRFALVPPDQTLPGWWAIRARLPAYAIAENSRALPRAFVPRAVRVVRTRQQSLAALQMIQDPAAEAVVQDGTALSTGENGPGMATMTGRGSRRIVRLIMARPGWVIVSDAHWAGWRASIEGRDLPLRFGDHAFLAFRVPAGRHTVRLFYRPPSFVIGAWISGVTALLLVLYALMPSSAITRFISSQTSFFAEGVRRR